MIYACVIVANKHPIRKIDRMMVNGAMRTREGRSWMEAIKKNVMVRHLTGNMALNRVEWKKKILMCQTLKFWDKGFCCCAKKVVPKLKI